MFRAALFMLSIVLADNKTNNIANATPDVYTNYTATGDFAFVVCPEGCYPQSNSDSFRCMCPVDQPKSDSGLKQSCNPQVEACNGYVKIIEVDAGFAYEPSAGLWYVIAMFVVMGYASYAPGTWTTADSLHTAWVYNFGIMTATWGITLLLWTQKVLFQSEGGIMHRLFVFWVNFSAIDLYLFYWLIDLIIFRATLSYAGSDKQEWWFKFAGLFAIQIFASYVQIVYRGSINFDYDIL